jgi:tRNA(Ile)-lysidine synthase
LFKTSYLKYEIIGTDILVGARREGDSLRPAGRGLSKKLKSLFMEKSVPVHKRDIVPVIRDEKGILMVRGIATDERCTVKIGEKALKISFEEIKTDA